MVWGQAYLTRHSYQQAVHLVVSTLALFAADGFVELVELVEEGSEEESRILHHADPHCLSCEFRD